LDGHLTGSAAIVDHTGERILIMLHKSCKFGFSLEAMRMAMEIYLGLLFVKLQKKQVSMG